MTVRKKDAPKSLRQMFPNVKHVVDSNKAIDVSVTPEDCRSGKRLDPKNCALARAAKREFKVDAVVIGLSASYIIKGDKAIRFKTPERVAREIVSFDRHSDFEPGEYHLPPHPPAQRLGVKRRPGRGGGANKTATRVVHKAARVRLFGG